MIDELHKVIKRLHDPLEVMLTCVCWYVAYPPSLRHIEEMRQERRVLVDHTAVHRWSIKIVPVLDNVFRRRKRSVGSRWRLDDTYIKVAGQWKYLCRAVDREGDTIDKSGANTAAIDSSRTDIGADIELRQIKSLNNIVEKDYRAIKRIVRPMLGFKRFRCARIPITGIETMHMIKKEPLCCPERLVCAKSILFPRFLKSNAYAISQNFPSLLQHNRIQSMPLRHNIKPFNGNLQ